MQVEKKTSPIMKMPWGDNLFLRHFILREKIAKLTRYVNTQFTRDENSKSINEESIFSKL